MKNNLHVFLDAAIADFDMRPMHWIVNISQPKYILIILIKPKN